MLIGIPALLGPDMLYTLRSMGHGDEIAIVDGNYPALEHGRRVVRADGLELIPVLKAILSVMPIDRFTPDAIFRSSQFNDAAKFAPIHHEIDAVVASMVPDVAVRAMSGDDLYPRIRQAHTIVATSEPALYANVILRKGVIEP